MPWITYSCIPSYERSRLVSTIVIILLGMSVTTCSDISSCTKARLISTLVVDVTRNVGDHMVLVSPRLHTYHIFLHYIV